MLKKAKWKDDCLSPILLGIDDLCDGYFKKEHQKFSHFSMRAMAQQTTDLFLATLIKTYFKNIPK